MAADFVESIEIMDSALTPIESVSAEHEDWEARAADSSSGFQQKGEDTRLAAEERHGIHLNGAVGSESLRPQLQATMQVVPLRACAQAPLQKHLLHYGRDLRCQLQGERTGLGKDVVRSGNNFHASNVQDSFLALSGTLETGAEEDSECAFQEFEVQLRSNLEEYYALHLKNDEMHAHEIKELMAERDSLISELNSSRAKCAFQEFTVSIPTFQFGGEMNAVETKFSSGEPARTVESVTLVFDHNLSESAHGEYKDRRHREIAILCCMFCASCEKHAYWLSMCDVYSNSLTLC